MAKKEAVQPGSYTVRYIQYQADISCGCGWNLLLRPESEEVICPQCGAVFNARLDICVSPPVGDDR